MNIPMPEDLVEMCNDQMKVQYMMKYDHPEDMRVPDASILREVAQVIWDAACVRLRASSVNPDASAKDLGGNA